MDRSKYIKSGLKQFAIIFLAVSLPYLAYRAATRFDNKTAPAYKDFSLDTWNLVLGEQKLAGADRKVWSDWWKLYFQKRKTNTCSVVYLHAYGPLPPGNSFRATLRGNIPTIKKIFPGDRDHDMIGIMGDFGGGVEYLNAPPPYPISCREVPHP